MPSLPSAKMPKNGLPAREPRKSGPATGSASCGSGPPASGDGAGLTSQPSPAPSLPAPPKMHPDGSTSTSTAEATAWWELVVYGGRSRALPTAGGSVSQQARHPLVRHIEDLTDFGDGCSLGAQAPARASGAVSPARAQEGVSSGPGGRATTRPWSGRRAANGFASPVVVRRRHCPRSRPQGRRGQEAPPRCCSGCRPSTVSSLFAPVGLAPIESGVVPSPQQGVA